MLKKTITSVTGRLDAVFQMAFLLWVKLRNYLFWKFTTSEEKDAWSAKRFANQSAYMPGGEYFNQGLFSWEHTALETYFPKEGHILIGGCGAGRVVGPLLQKNFRVTGFDPSPELISAAVTEFPEGQFYQSSYREWIENFQRNSQVRFDGIILSWGSFSNITNVEERSKLLTLFHRVSPKAPVLVSFHVSQNDKPLDSYWPHAGFVHLFTKNELGELAEKSGYTVVQSSFSIYPQPFAVLRPTS